MSENKRVFIFGFGYTAAALARQLMAEGWEVGGTSRHLPRRREMQRLGIKAWDFLDVGLVAAFKDYDYLLCTIPPIKLGDTVLKHYAEAITAQKWRWIGYLSTTGVYGDTGGEWVDEATPVKGDNERTRARVVAERKWLELYQHQLPVHIFRLAGIYGPGRGVVAKLRRGVEQRIYKENQVFSRIHVADIVRALKASMLQPQPGSVYNICDDLPAPSHEVVEFAAHQLGVDVPPMVDWQQANLSEMAKEFYNSNRRVKNERIKSLLPEGRWLYPTYKEGIAAEVAAIRQVDSVEEAKHA